MPEDAENRQHIVDYDSNQYDYRTYWEGRDYEQHAESKALERLLEPLGRVEWFADFGGAYGRNAVHYRNRVAHGVIIDYSKNNMTNASEIHAEDIRTGKIHLVRSDVAHMPFIDSAFDAALVMRVLHHLPDIEAALREMARAVADYWLIDVPIKHHVLARLRGAVRGTSKELKGPEPAQSGTSETPFNLFHLETIRERLAEYGWDTEVAASINNLRRWDQIVPKAGVTVLRPLANGVEAVAQRVGKGWWGPEQLLVGKRRARGSAQLRPIPPDLDPVVAQLAARTQCPTCRGPLAWSNTAARCETCARDFPRVAGYWDFVAD